MLASFHFRARLVVSHTAANTLSSFVTALPRPYMALADLVFVIQFLQLVTDNTPIPGLQMNLLESYSSFVIPHAK